MNKTALYVSFLIVSNSAIVSALGSSRLCVHKPIRAVAMRTFPYATQPMPQQLLAPAAFTPLRHASLSSFNVLSRQAEVSRQEEVSKSVRLLGLSAKELFDRTQTLLKELDNESAQPSSTPTSTRNSSDSQMRGKKPLAHMTPFKASGKTMEQHKTPELQSDLRKLSSHAGLKCENTSIVSGIRDEFLKRVLSLAKNSDINPKEVRALIELYGANVSRPKNAITKVLSSATDKSGTETYKEVVVHIEDKGSDLDVYRDIYSRLSHALDGKALSFIYHLVQKGKCF